MLNYGKLFQFMHERIKKLGSHYRSYVSVLPPCHQSTALAGRGGGGEASAVRTVDPHLVDRGLANEPVRRNVLERVPGTLRGAGPGIRPDAAVPDRDPLEVHIELGTLVLE